MLSETRIREIVADVIKFVGVELSTESSLGTTDGWDSLAQLEIITRLEQESGVRLSAEDSIYAESLADLISLFSKNNLTK
jgi:acyl carrier protein